MTTLQVGDKAPEFEGIDQNGSEVKSTDLAGKKYILYFYPKDDTPGCTAQACNLRDNISELKKEGFTVIGVSPDNAAKHLRFIDKYNLPFPLIADTEQSVLKAFGVWGPKKFMGREYVGVHRTTFVIDEEGVIIQVFSKVKTKAHTAQILEAINS